MQGIEFIKTKLNEEIKQMISNYYSDLQYGTDDFFEGHIKESDFYIIRYDGSVIGVFGSKDDEVLTFIYLDNAYKSLYKQVFDCTISYEHTRKIMTVTNDTNMLNQIIIHNFTIVKQAYNFCYIGETIECDFLLQEARLEDAENIKDIFGDHFEDYEEKIQRKELYVGSVEGEIVSLGLIVPHSFCDNTVSIGMVTAKEHRRKGYATKTIIQLINTCIDLERQIRAGCSYYNHASKRTLEKAGLIVSNLIIRVNMF